MDTSKLKEYSFEIGPIRPPSEGGSYSLLIRATRNCPWNRCGFCYGSPYGHEKFQLRTTEEVKGDIDAVRAISSEIKSMSWKLGYGGRIEPLAQVLQSSLLYGKGVRQLVGDELGNFQCILNVFNWLCAGGKTVFLQDADTMIMPTPQLVEVISYLKQAFPSLTRVTSYARAKTVSRKKPEELKQLREVGLTRIHIGLETGDGELLQYVEKGVTPEEQISAGRKAIEAGLELSEYVMPGLGGRKWWEQHARNTARVLSEISPQFIRLRPFVPRPGTPMFEAYEKGEFELTSPHERLREIRLMVEELTASSRLCFDHNLNPAYVAGNRLVPLLKQDYEGYRLPDEKTQVLELIDRGLAMPEGLFVNAKDMISMPGL